MAISEIECKKCHTKLLKNYCALINEELAAKIMAIHDKVAHTNDYRITLG